MASRKAELRKINREEKRKRAERRQRWASWGFKAALALLIPLVLFVFWQGWNAGSAALPPAEVGASDHVKGNADSNITLTIYGDFQCPACKVETQILERAWPRISDKVRVVFRHYPLDIHRHAFLAARYAEAAGRQGKFWELHDVFYANQELWSSAADATPLFDEYARSVGLDLDKLKADLNTSEVRDKVLADQRGGTRAGVRATPSLFLNGRLLARNPASVTELVDLIERAQSSAN
jgi:Protein-disulfide isomerase